MPAELSGPGLDRAIAEALGWPTHEWEWTQSPHVLLGRAARCIVRNTDFETNGHGEHCIPLHDDHAALFLPHYSTNLNALRDEPWKVLRERGLTAGYREWADGLCQWMWYRHEDEEVAEGEAPDFDIALAAARATLSALEAMKNDQ